MKAAVILLAIILTSCSIMPGLMAEPHTVSEGMTAAQVEDAMDGLEPDGVFSSGGVEVWTYIGDYSVWQFSFLNGIVTSISYIYLEEL